MEATFVNNVRKNIFTNIYIESVSQITLIKTHTKLFLLDLAFFCHISSGLLLSTSKTAGKGSFFIVFII